MYLTKSIPSIPLNIHRVFSKWLPVKKLLFGALMAALAAVLQSAGGLIPGVGFFISPFATAPILLATVVSLRTGVLTFLLTIFLLLLIEPSELMIFPFTTGLIGLGLGWAFCTLNSRIGAIMLNGLLLLMGICIPLYVLDFPVFGPTISSSVTLVSAVIILGFSIIYSWIWVEFGLFFLRKIKSILGSL